MVLHTKKSKWSHLRVRCWQRTLHDSPSFHKPSRCRGNSRPKKMYSIFRHIQEFTPASSQSWDMITTPQWERVINNDSERHLQRWKKQICSLAIVHTLLYFPTINAKGWNMYLSSSGASAGIVLTEWVFVEGVWNVNMGRCIGHSN